MAKARVLVIDDDPMITQLLHEHLTNEGYEVAEVHMGEEGYARAVKNPPDLIFLDVMLPDSTGFQMLGRLRDNPITKSVPVIMMSGTARHANQLAIGKNMGADRYIVKPFDVGNVGDQVQDLLKNRPASKPTSAPVTEPAPAPKQEAEPEPEPQLEPKLEPTPEPKPIPMTELKWEPKPEPRWEPKPEPKLEPLPVVSAPKPVPIPVPTPQAIPASAPQLLPWKITWKLIGVVIFAALAWAVLVGFIVVWILTSRGYLHSY